MQTIKFRTEYTPVRENFTLNPEKPVLLMYKRQEYIWDVFQETYLDSVGKEKLKAGEKETKRSLHRNIIGNR